MNPHLGEAFFWAVEVQCRIVDWVTCSGKRSLALGAKTRHAKYAANFWIFTISGILISCFTEREGPQQ